MKQKILIACREGAYEEVEADVVNGLAVHRSLDQPGYVLTHVGSGRRLCRAMFESAVSEVRRSVLVKFNGWDSSDMRAVAEAVPVDVRYELVFVDRQYLEDLRMVRADDE
jgi:hypothetical protein